MWNIRSVNTQQAFPSVINMNREHNFCIVALMEPFQKKGLIERYKRRLNMETAYTNINGQIWLFFNAVVEWELVEDTEQQVTVRVFHHDLGQRMMMTFVYAKCSVIERLELWDHLYYLASDMELPWLVGGDFNVLLHEDEKIGGLPIHPPEYEDFAFCVNSCGLFEQGYKGSPFTWWNGRSNAECIFNRLDRIFVNFPFQNMLPTIEVEHLIRTRSDHAPLLMTCGVQTTKFVKSFRFLNFWTKHATFMDVVRQNWEADFIGDPFMMFKIVLQKAQSELKKYLNIEEQYWKQKSGMNWFAEGDRNTSLQEVEELQQGETWDDQLLDQTFNEEIAEHIRLNVHYEGSEGYWDKPY
ncbi:uncharacterized protein [Nicotiana tomentosiformis]|uniref:uncharacterized protein n=1 Tax=Nicotiana tomentosiformis TaxID=4098 RepID=UPI00388C40B6